MTYSQERVLLGRAFDPKAGPLLTDQLQAWDFDKFQHMFISGRAGAGKTVLAKTIAAQWAMSGRPVVGWFEDGHFGESKRTEGCIQELLTSAYGEGLPAAVLIIVDGYSSAPTSLQQLVQELLQVLPVTGARFHLLVTDQANASLNRNIVMGSSFHLRCHVRPQRAHSAAYLPNVAEEIYDCKDFVAVLQGPLASYTYLTLEDAGRLYQTLTFQSVG